MNRSPRSLPPHTPRFIGPCLLSRGLFGLLLLLLLANGARSATVTCGANGPEDLAPGAGEDLEVVGPCNVRAQTYRYGYVNIYRPANAPEDAPAAELRFADPGTGGLTHFWAQSILVEQDGSLVAGSATDAIAGSLTIHLYGYDEREGIQCKRPRCGLALSDWTDAPTKKIRLPSPPDQTVMDYFYRYGPLQLTGEGKPDPRAGFFGYKVLAVSYGGTLKLFGERGGVYPYRKDQFPSRTSWARLARDLPPADCNAQPCTLKLDRKVDWQQGDRIVVTTTDYLPGHSEEFTVGARGDDKTQVEITDSKVKYPHDGTPYSLKRIPDRLKLNKPGQRAETRAAVALLSRSIRIVSEGSPYPAPLPGAKSTDPHRFFGGHTIVRQGVKEYQVQGVEFYQLGQGGRIGHYPVHFHMVRTAPQGISVRDSAVHDSMTRWYTVHATHGVTLERNVGYKSVGHGYYIEDGTEINNRFDANLGIFARAAVDNDQNDRRVPGILDYSAQESTYPASSIRFHSDSHHPTLFWIMNGWNEFTNNMMVGAGTCGACYWLAAGANSGASRDQRWESYASMQDSNRVSNLDRVGTTPLHIFRGNTCSTAMQSFTVQMEMGACKGVGLKDPDNLISLLHPLSNPWAPTPDPAYVTDKKEIQERYYPLVRGIRHATRCPDDQVDCSAVPLCSGGAATNNPNCMVTALENYTTAFNWAETNFSAIWLRPQWGLVTDSVVSDVQNAGVTFVSGGDYTYSSNPPGNWNLARKTVFIGETQSKNPLASRDGAFNSAVGGLKCDRQTNGAVRGDFCLSKKEGVSIQLANFAVNQRLFNVYDGPAYEHSNAFLDIHVSDLTKCKLEPQAGPNRTCNAPDDNTVQAYLSGVPYGNPDNSRKGNRCYLPHAAIGWKQPNGFYYPPTFHSENLFFSEVDIRHFVIDPLFDLSNPFPFHTDTHQSTQSYCTRTNNMWNGFTDVDRQTELSDDDGSLTGFVNTVSVNNDPFFTAPVEMGECLSGTTYDTVKEDPINPITDYSAKTSPYEYVTTVVYPGCAANKTAGAALLACEGHEPPPPSSPEPPPPPPPSAWSQDCTNETCFGVPLYRRLTTQPENARGDRPMMRMMGQSTYQRSNLTVNNGDYFIDTTVSEAAQRRSGDTTCAAGDPNPENKRWCNINLFEKNQKYYVFLLYVKPGMQQTYRLYVGEKFVPATDLRMVRTDIAPTPLKFNEQTWPASWPPPKLAANGVLTVTMRFNAPAFKKEYEEAKKENCAPKSFCEWNEIKGACETSETLKRDNPALYENAIQDNHSICRLTQKDVDCPKGGCYGFSIKLADDFHTRDGTPPPPPRAPTPAPNCIDAGDPFYKFWNVDFQPADPERAGECLFAPLIERTFCAPKPAGAPARAGTPRFGSSEVP